MKYFSDCANRIEVDVTQNRCTSVTNQLGFTLVEMLIVVAVIGVLATMAIFSYDEVRVKAKRSVAVTEIRGIEQQVSAYLVEKAVLPDALTDVPNAILIDPWRNQYMYKNLVKFPGTGLKYELGLLDYNTDFDVYSRGTDGDTAIDFDPSDPKTTDDVVRAGDGGYVGLRNF